MPYNVIVMRSNRQKKLDVCCVLIIMLGFALVRMTGAASFEIENTNQTLFGNGSILAVPAESHGFSAFTDDPDARIYRPLSASHQYPWLYVESGKNVTICCDGRIAGFFENVSHCLFSNEDGVILMVPVNERPINTAQGSGGLLVNSALETDNGWNGEKGLALGPKNTGANRGILISGGMPAGDLGSIYKAKNNSNAWSQSELKADPRNISEWDSYLYENGELMAYSGSGEPMPKSDLSWEDIADKYGVPVSELKGLAYNPL